MPRGALHCREIETNLIAGWAGILLGIMAGAASGLFFWREDWLGGYGSWRRRLVRLAHVSFFGLGFLNIALALSIPRLGLAGARSASLASVALILGALTMPLVCYLAAWRQPLRHLFVVPVTLTAAGVALVVGEALLR
jgi:hypothetical protein